MTNIKSILLMDNKYINYMFNSTLVLMAIIIMFAYPIADTIRKLSIIVYSLVTSSIICALFYIPWFVIREDIFCKAVDRTNNPLRLICRFCGSLIMMIPPFYMYLDCIYKFNLSNNPIIYPIMLVSMFLSMIIFSMSFCIGKK